MIFVSPTRKALSLLLFLLITPGAGTAQQGTREVMADAMSRMMEAMGLFDSSSAGTRTPLGGSGWGWEPGPPWGGPGQGRSQASPMGKMMRQFSRQMYPPNIGSRDWPMTWKPSPLEGVWEGRDGELLVVQGNRFRIYSPTMQRVDGLMQIKGDRLALYNPLDQHAQPFEFAESHGRLVMRDLAGQIYLYRRLRLDRDRGQAAAWMSPDR
jgi:hypothetical protein